MTLQKALEIFNIKSLEEISKDEIKKIYRKQAGLKHPDKEGGSSQEFVELRQAYLYILSHYPNKEIKKTGKDLKELSKDEILDKYFQDTRELQVKVDLYESVTNTQIAVLDTVKTEAEDILARFEMRKAELKKELDKNVSELEKKYNPGFFARLISLFQNKMSEEEFWEKYHFEVQKYSRKDAELDVEFFKEMLTTYGGGLNKIANSITEI
jgi:curved DNA-binding protein CbpA